MNYLFFDCEFATTEGGNEKMCEFGFVVVNENFSILNRGNIIINPNIKSSEWDRYALKHILTRTKEEYENRLFFLAYHKRIILLIQNANFIFGHTINGDVHALNCELKRYNLPALDFDFYDIKEIYKVFTDTNKSVSLESILSELGIKGDDKKHDAEVDSYNTMLELKTILEKGKFKLEEMLEMCPNAKDRTEQFMIDSKIKAERAKAEKQKAIFGDGKTGMSDNSLSRENEKNYTTFRQFLDNIQVTKRGAGKFKDKKISISINYEIAHYKEMMNIVQIIKNEGGEYILKASEADIFVTYPRFYEDGTPCNCNREKYVDIALTEGKKIQKMTFNEFLSVIGVTNEELEGLPLPPLDCLTREDAIIKNKKFSRK